MTDYMQHYYADEPECVWCGHYGPVDDPDEPCARRVDVARAVWKLRQSERALREQLKALLGTTNADKSTEENSERIYPCARCGVMRSKAEGGTVFTVCDDCWDLSHPDRANANKAQEKCGTCDGAEVVPCEPTCSGYSCLRPCPKCTTNADKSQSSKCVDQFKPEEAVTAGPGRQSQEIVNEAASSSPPRLDTRSGLADCEQLGGPAAPVTAGENPAGGVFGSAGLEIDHRQGKGLLPEELRKRVSLKINSVKRMEFEPDPEDYQDQLRNEANQADARPYAFPDGSPEPVKSEPRDE